MKFIAVPILILLLLTQTFSKWVTILDYEINKDFIAKNLCENRTRPQLHCNGKCVLMRKLMAQEKNEATIPGIKFSPEVQLFSQPNDDYALPPLLNLDKQFSFFILKSYKQEILFAVFHPPTV